MIRIPKDALFVRRNRPTPIINLRMKMIGLIGVLVLTIVILMGGFLNHFLSETLETQIGERALDVAKSVSLIPEIAEAFSAEDPASIIQPIVDPIQEQTDAEYIVIGNLEEIRYSHPNPDRIGKKMVGEDNELALQSGESYISTSTGTLGDSLRAKVPIFSDGQVIGVVSVGFLNDSIESVIWDYNKEIWMVLIGIAAAAIIGAIFIANYIKKVLYGLEPEEISHLLFQKETILHSIHEGIVAVNTEGRITTINSAALRLLTGQDQPVNLPIGENIRESFPNSNLPHVLESATAIYDEEKLLGNHLIYVNSVPIYYENELLGAVSTFRNKTEIENLTKKLANVQQYANALRSQTHEFSNKLYTIMGLTRLHRKEEVLAFIQEEMNVQQGWIDTLLDEVHDPYVSGLLVGKLNQASELKITVKIQPDSQLHAELPESSRQALLTAVGNLLDNAFDAVYAKQAISREISIFFTDIGHDLLFEIDDAGSGLSDIDAQCIFQEGFSSKADSGRGFGLALTKQALDTVKGHIWLEPSELGGTCFVVSIPKIYEGDVMDEK